MAVNFSEFGATPPIIDAIKSKRNFFFIIVGVVFLVDWMTGSPLTLKFVNFQWNLSGVNPGATGFKFQTIIGTYNNPQVLAKMYDKLAGTIAFTIVALSYLLSFWATVQGKRIIKSADLD